MDIGERQAEPAGGLAREAKWRGAGEDAALLKIVARARGVSVEQILHATRLAPIVLARHIAMYLLHVELGRSMSAVARLMRRDRATVSYACARIEEMRESRAFDAELAGIEDRLRPTDASGRAS